MIMRSDDWSRATVCPHGCTRASWNGVNPALVSSSAAVCTLSASTTSNSMLAWARVDPPAIPGRRSRPARPGSAAKRRSSGCRRRLHCASSRPVRSRAVIRGDHRNAADEMHLHAVTSRHRSHHTDFGKRVRQHCFRPRRRPTSPSATGLELDWSRSTDAGSRVPQFPATPESKSGRRRRKHRPTYGRLNTNPNFRATSAIMRPSED